MDGHAARRTPSQPSASRCDCIDGATTGAGEVAGCGQSRRSDPGPAVRRPLCDAGEARFGSDPSRSRSTTRAAQPPRSPRIDVPAFESENIFDIKRLHTKLAHSGHVDKISTLTE
jgi:hypothetical protein